MKNTHIEHPEDSILTGDLSVLDWFLAESHLSVKIDGAPAIVWGTDPATGTFFVGTKSVFNKKKIKINHSHQEIDLNHTGNVADILHRCFDALPRIDWIAQGDFIGFGGSDTYCPNTITYCFREIIEQDVIIAPHTVYVAEHDLRDAIASPMILCPKSTSRVKFVKPECHQLDEDFDEIVAFARQMSTLVDFVNDKHAARLKKNINHCIRNNFSVNDDDFDCDPNLIRLWKLVKSIKDDMLFLCRDVGPLSFIGDDICDGEGYVRVNDYGVFKLVDRARFSHANFNNSRFHCAS